ncbi:MAG: hypothetical protein GWM90_28305 [Gemmatimonadetes bacterium]|nr:hypothetical protein [Gemmatimonadota bacterium]NIQ58937.1 hypothetical protein [Gemmatimonadota bacterium]NIU79127.1 hypothetical protein [Gammaproteobacteria bacterium]NIX47831.1 hypothetical protein [Gemmatimonadota bacterium]NIY12196.1 hypothetical protein [Gemmatimonadota bacterium]
MTGFVPGATDPDTILAVCWAFLLASLLLANTAYAAAAARDLASIIDDRLSIIDRRLSIVDHAGGWFPAGPLDQED